MSITILTDSPSTGKTIPIFRDNISLLRDSATVIWEAADFLVPLREEGEGVVVIETNEGEERQLVPGEAMFITPVTIANSTDLPQYVWLIVQQGSIEYDYVSRVYVPGNDTVQIGINGFSLVKSGAQEVDELGPMLKIYGRYVEDEDDTLTPLSLSLVTVVSEQENGSHAPFFQGIF